MPTNGGSNDIEQALAAGMIWLAWLYPACGMVFSSYSQRTPNFAIRASSQPIPSPSSEPRKHRGKGKAIGIGNGGNDADSAFIVQEMVIGELGNRENIVFAIVAAGMGWVHRPPGSPPWYWPGIPDSA